MIGSSVRGARTWVAASTTLALFCGAAQAQTHDAQGGAAAPAKHGGGEASLVLPNLDSATFMGVGGRPLLLGGLVICELGLLFGLVQYSSLKNMPVHKSMLEVSELIYETCKTYLSQQGKFLMILWIFIGAAVMIY